MPAVRPARAGEAASLTALCVRSKAHWGYEAEFMRLSAKALAVSEADIAGGGVLVAFDASGHTLGMANVVADVTVADLDALFVDPPAIGGGAGRALFVASIDLAPARGDTP